MYCRKCGNKLPEGARFCGACGAEQKQNSVNTDEKQPEIVYQGMPDSVAKKQESEPQDYKIKTVNCPKCGGKRLQITTETDTHVKTSGGGYSSTKGCLGWLVLGPFGLLCGNCGSKQKTSVDTTNKTYWVCSDCGNKFRNLEDWKNELEKEDTAMKASLGISVFALLGAAFFWLSHISFMGKLLLILAIVYVLMAFAQWNLLRKEKEEYQKLEHESTEA